MQTSFSSPWKRHHYPWLKDFLVPLHHSRLHLNHPPNHDFSTNLPPPLPRWELLAWRIEITLRSSMASRKILKFDPVYYLQYLLNFRIFDIFILNNFFAFQSLSKRSIKKKEINERKRKKKKSNQNFLILRFYRNVDGDTRVCALVYLNGTLLRSSKLYASV